MNTILRFIFITFFWQTLLRPLLGGAGRFAQRGMQRGMSALGRLLLLATIALGILWYAQSSPDIIAHITVLVITLFGLGIILSPIKQIFGGKKRRRRR